MIIPPNWEVPEAIRVRVGSSYGRQRAIVEEGHLLLILHKPPKPDQREREGILFWRKPAGDWACNAGGGGIRLLKDHIRSYAELEKQLDDEFESAKTAEELFAVLEEVAPVRRAAKNLFSAVQAAREGVARDTALIEARDLAYEVDRNLELLHEETQNAIDYRIAKQGEEQAKLTQEAIHASHRLNILAALFLPLATITSLFGMNLAHGLDQGSPPLFWAVFAIGLVIGFMMKGWVLSTPGKE
ncbi:MAG: CorA family divalent cation transporter [Verrucomicrobiota bacterium]